MMGKMKKTYMVCLLRFVVASFLATCAPCVESTRSGSRYSYSRYAGSTYRTYRAYRSNGYYGHGYDAYYSNRYYRSWIPIRYARTYNMQPGAYYYYYYNRYFTYRPAVSSMSGRRCYNYEANDNDTVLGVFHCPLPFEPSDHAYCCGENFAQYCCKFIDVKQYRIGIALATVFCIFLLSAMSVCIFQSCAKSNRKSEQVITKQMDESITLIRRTVTSRQPTKVTFHPYTTPSPKKVAFMTSSREEESAL